MRVWQITNLMNDASTRAGIPHDLIHTLEFSSAAARHRLKEDVPCVAMPFLVPVPYCLLSQLAHLQSMLLLSTVIAHVACA